MKHPCSNIVLVWIFESVNILVVFMLIISGLLVRCIVIRSVLLKKECVVVLKVAANVFVGLWLNLLFHMFEILNICVGFVKEFWKSCEELGFVS